MIWKKNLDYCSLCLSLEDKIKTIECTCSGLRQGIEQKRNEFKLLEDKFEVLKRRNLELEEKIRRIENKEENKEEDRVLQFMIENSVLECEKRKAESDGEYWKKKCNELQLTVAELENKLVSEAGDRISAKVQGLQGECNNLAQKMYPQEVYTITKVDEIQSKASLDANPFLADGETRSLQSQGSGKSFAKTPSVQAKLVGVNKALLSGNGNNRVNKVRKRLTFEEEERGSNKRMAPSTPAAAKVVVIDVTESDDERTTGLPYNTSTIRSDYETSVPFDTPSIPGIARSVPFCGSGSTFSNIELPSENDSKMTGMEQVEDSDMVCHNEGALYVPTPKRRRASNIIASDSDTDDDDKVPISMLKTRHFHKKSSDDHPGGHCTQTGDSKDEVGKLSSRRRLVKLSQFEGKSGGGGNDIEEVSDSEGESLGGFIVSSSDLSDDDDISNSDGALKSNSSVAEDSVTDSEYISESDSDYGEIISKIRRNKSDKLEWEFEGDMLAAFGKDPELCMRAVCVLYRQQTSFEQCIKETIVHNQRGFSHCDAFRGSNLAEFLSDGDPQGDVMKSVKDLQEYDPRGIEVCTTLATRYSKQLFSIYKNKEDPFFSAP